MRLSPRCVGILGLISALTTGYLSGCSSSPSVKPIEDVVNAPSKSKSSVLTAEQAAIRAKQIHRVAYNLWFDVDATHPDFQGRTVINFDFRDKARSVSSELLLDFSGAQIRSLSINGQLLNADQIKSRYDGERITFKVSELLSGANRIEIAYAHPFSTDGRGLYRFKDPVDGAVYLYSDLEPYDAHTIFPCFDQPDLKASYEVTVEAPNDWMVISNMLERDITTVDGHKSWQFPPSPVFSTYVFALHAGPYKSWKGNANGIPLRLMARKSLAQYVEAAEWLDITKRGLEFFNTQFGLPYPYSKYDQIIVPDFNAGAMENVGAVTFSERFIHRSKVTVDKKRDRADVILHEMAHMWFGNLVTMKWWNGLWLNESFATFMAALAVDRSTQFKNTWQSFYKGMKQWAYHEDQLVTTHPIEVPVTDTDQAFANFDGITYGKGASALKQLSYYIGEDDFREGLQRYFQKFANRNTTIGDFMKMLSEASGQNLTEWQKAWLQTPGVNSVEAQWQCNDGKISSFVLKQGPSEFNKVLRPHKTLVGLFYRQGELKAGETIEVEYSKAETPVAKAIGMKCPALVFPNYQDYDFVKVNLDPISLNTVRTNLAKISDSLTRHMMWQTLGQMVVDGKLIAQDYAQIVFDQLSGEKDIQIVTDVVKSMAQASANGIYIEKILTGHEREEFSKKYQAFANKQLVAAAPASDLQLVWYQALIASTRDEKSTQFLADLLAGKKSVSGLKIEQERRWELLRALARNNYSGTLELIQKELKQDATDTGQKEAISAEAQIPTEENKNKWFKQIIERKEKLGNIKPAMKSFFTFGHEKLLSEYVDRYFEQLEKLAKVANEEYLKDYSHRMFPALCSEEVISKTSKAIDSNLPVGVLKGLKMARQEEERCLRARKLSGQK